MLGEARMPQVRANAVGRECAGALTAPIEAAQPQRATPAPGLGQRVELSERDREAGEAVALAAHLPFEWRELVRLAEHLLERLDNPLAGDRPLPGQQHLGGNGEGMRQRDPRPRRW